MKLLTPSLLATAAAARSLNPLAPRAELELPEITSAYAYGSGCPAQSLTTSDLFGDEFPTFTLNAFNLDTTDPAKRALDCTVVLKMTNFTPGETIMFHSANLEGFAEFETGSWIEWLGVQIFVNDNLIATAGIKEEWGRNKGLSWRFSDIQHFETEAAWNTCDTTPEEIELKITLSAQLAVVFKQDGSIPRGVLGMESDGTKYPLILKLETEVEEC